MRRDCNDIDIATSAKPEEVQKLFDKTIPVGEKFGTIIVVVGKHQFEVTSFRAEGPYTDGRRPSSISYTDAKEDARRRDFTINGVFYNPTNGSFIDYVGGIDDIKKHVISFIGNSEDRINEDKLRLIRAVRFKVTLGFQYAQETFDAIRKNSKKIREVSFERIRDELNKILLSSNRHVGIVELSESGILKEIIPELEKMKGVAQPEEYHHEGDCFTHIYLALKSLPQDVSLVVCWAVLLHDIAKPVTLKIINGKVTFHDHATRSAEMSREILKRLKFSNSFIEDVAYLIHYHMSLSQIDQMKPSKKLDFLTDRRFEPLIELVGADSKGTYPINLEFVDRMKRLQEIAKMQAQITAKLKEVPRLITGSDLIALGLTEKIKFTEILENVYNMQLEESLKSKEEALQYIKENYK